MDGPEEINQRNDERLETSADGAPLTDFEQLLQRAMRPAEMSPDTMAKLLALAEREERRQAHDAGGPRLVNFSRGSRVLMMPKLRAWTGGAIAAVLAMGCFVGAHLHVQHERRIQADQQFEAAERITDQTLARTREQLEQRGIQLYQ